jgi:hypothetical protein
MRAGKEKEMRAPRRAADKLLRFARNFGYANRYAKCPGQKPMIPFDYKFDRSGYMSVWVSEKPWSALPADYLDQNDPENPDDEGRRWANWFRFAYYDIDLFENNSSELPVSPADLIAGCSYAEQIGPAFTDACHSKGLYKIRSLVMLCEFAYDIRITNIETDGFFIFVGAFQYA